MKTSEIAENLVGKWFYKLRWAGLINDGSLYILQWISVENGIQSGPVSNTTNILPSFQVNLRLISDYVINETNAVTTERKSRCYDGIIYDLTFTYKTVSKKA